MLPKRIIAAGVGTLVVAGGVAAGGVAAADSGTSGTGGSSTAAGSSSTGTSTTSSKAHPRRHFLARRTLHGELVVRGRGGKDVTIDVVRGTVSAVSPTSITITSRDGFSATYAVTSATRVHLHGQKSKASIGVVKKGDRVGAFGAQSGTTVTARAINDRGTK